MYLRPGEFVVYDRTSVTDSTLDQWMAFHFTHRPVLAGGTGGEIAKFLHRQVDDARVFQVAGRGHEDVAGVVMTAEIAREALAVEAADGLSRAQDRPPQGMAAPVALREDLVHQVVGRVLHHLDLFPDHLGLLRNVFRLEQRVLHQVRQDVEGPRQVLVQDLDGEARVFFGRESVKVAANRIR